MSWTTIASSAATWGEIASSVKDWTAQSRAVVPPAWGIMSSITTSVDLGVDFLLRIREEFPIRASADRPVVIREIQPEGLP